MQSNDERSQARGEFYLCLAHAFLTPDGEGLWTGLRDDLADNLEELGDLLDYGLSGELAGYRSALAAIPDQPTLLQVYSGLFLAPPRRVNLNSGLYLDGTVNGGSVAAMEEAYRMRGLERSGDFKDLADHVAIQLEFVGHGFTAWPEVAESFLGGFVLRWLPPFIADLERNGGETNPYLHLARALSCAVARDAKTPLPCQGEAQSRLQSALGQARHNRAESGVTEDDMAFIARRLKEKGLATDHLAIAPERRDEAMGLTRKVPPAPRRAFRPG
ncbi:molecular chaperone [Magnetospirillum sp. SS-4]|uniref:TorD/DmsD family molecular chaperone n=1 Tax=Magnetospirillum sp. SS-4 TaxID=2681465 RepID=UPI0013815743|nr:molecular chaperone TorD family protein [Magnetospirillum sp. SS-4]CAA7616381.1 putative Cytoplasmic chaperone TorD family protein [Magnetospirillum sp. SS-4]